MFRFSNIDKVQGKNESINDKIIFDGIEVKEIINDTETQIMLQLKIP